MKYEVLCFSYVNLWLVSLIFMFEVMFLLYLSLIDKGFASHLL
jgi:hypothetical protein